MYKQEKENVVGLLIGNKCDRPSEVDINEVEKFAEEHGLIYMETSAKSDKNIKKAIVRLLKKIKDAKLLFDSTSSVDTQFSLKLEQSAPENDRKNEGPKPKKKKCNC